MSPKIDDLERVLRDVPAMPVVAQKVMQMLGDANTTNSNLGETIAADPSLAARILTMANSPFFGTRQKISTISNAVFILGHAALRSLVITVCTKGLFKNPALMEEKLWEHSLGAAIAARQIADKTGVWDPDEAFVIGLLHDIGKISLVTVYHDDYRKVFMECYNNQLILDDMIDLEKEEFGYDHTEVGARVIVKWRLPDFYSRAARRHHAYSLDLLQHEEEPKVIAIAGQANIIALRLGLGLHQPDKRVDVVGTPYNELLNLQRDGVLQVIEKTLHDYKESREQFNL